MSVVLYIHSTEKARLGCGEGGGKMHMDHIGAYFCWVRLNRALRNSVSRVLAGTFELWTLTGECPLRM